MPYTIVRVCVEVKISKEKENVVENATLKTVPPNINSRTVVRATPVKKAHPAAESSGTKMPGAVVLIPTNHTGRGSIWCIV